MATNNLDRPDDERPSRLANFLRIAVRLVPIALIVLLFVALLLPKLLGVRDVQRRVQCQRNFEVLLHALLSYREDNGRFPPAYVAGEDGNRLHSWRAGLLPWIDGDLAADYRYDEPWDSEHNRRLAQRRPSVFVCPSDRDAARGDTSYLAVVGPQTAFDEHLAGRLEETRDGLANTILIVEVADSDINWLEPRDLLVEEALEIGQREGLTIRSGHTGGAYVGMADGQIRFLSERIDPQVLRRLLTVGEPE